VVVVAGAPRAVEGAAGFAPKEKEGAEVAGADQSTQGNINFESILMIMKLFAHLRYSLMWQEAWRRTRKELVLNQMSEGTLVRSEKRGTKELYD